MNQEDIYSYSENIKKRWSVLQHYMNELQLAPTRLLAKGETPVHELDQMLEGLDRMHLLEARGAELIEAVRERLVTELSTPEPPNSPVLRIVTSEPDRDSLEADGGHDDGNL